MALTSSYDRHVNVWIMDWAKALSLLANVQQLLGGDVLHQVTRVHSESVADGVLSNCAQACAGIWLLVYVMLSRAHGLHFASILAFPPS